MPENRHLRFLLRLLWAALLLGGLWLACRVVLPWVLPFLAALALSALMEPAVRFLTARLRLGRRWAAGLCAAALTALLLGAAGLLLWRGWYELTGLLDRLPALAAGLPELAAGLEDRLRCLLIALPIPLQEPVAAWLEGLVDRGAGLPEKLVEWVADVLGAVAAALPAAALFTVTALLAAYLISAGRPELLALVRRNLSAQWQAQLTQLGTGIKQALGGWLRAQLLLALLTFGELTVGLLLLRVEPALLLAGLIALLDALPVFGAAVILVPWGGGALVTGHTLLGCGLLALCGLVTVMRSLLEPRLLGRRVGLHPLAALISLYVGFQIWGVWGMILGPLLASVGKQLWAGGFFKGLRPGRADGTGQKESAP